MTTAHLALVASDALATCRPIPGAREVTSLADLDRLLRATCSSTSTSLDLYGHATRGHNHLRIGRDVLDALDPRVAAFFASLVTDRVLARAGIVQLRMLGCATAIGPAARASLTRLARLTGVPVLGTRRALLAAHHGPDGLRPAFAHLLETFTPTPLGWPPWNRRGRTAVSARSA